MQIDVPAEMIRKSFMSRHIGKILVLLGAVAIISALIVIGFYNQNFSNEISVDHAVWGQFGDFVGGTLNPFFSLLAFFALLITIIIQNRELSISSEELAKSAKALNEQSDSLRLQNFENTFFQMVRLHNEIVGDMDTERADDPTKSVSGRDCFEQFYVRLTAHYRKVLRDDVYKGPSQLINDSYESFFRERQAEIGHYFRNLYTIIKIVDNGPVENKKQYTNIVRAQLSSYELALLFYNCIWIVGKEKFKSLVERYELLENMDKRLIMNLEEHIPLYDDGAYGESDFYKQ